VTRLLLDTHVLLWAVGDPERLAPDVRRRISDRTREVCFSVASLWEVAIKSALGRSDFSADPALLRRGLLTHGYVELPIGGEAVLELASIPQLHKDPFDRILLCQARVEGAVLLTVDRQLAAYGPPVELV